MRLPIRFSPSLALLGSIACVALTFAGADPAAARHRRHGHRVGAADLSNASALPRYPVPPVEAGPPVAPVFDPIGSALREATAGVANSSYFDPSYGYHDYYGPERTGPVLAPPGHGAFGY